MSKAAFLDHRLEIIPDFESSVLGHSRSIRVYLPPSYCEEEELRYPVLYMHDGQGLFDPNPMSGTSWHMHETTDRLIAEGRLQEILIVGIDNRGEARSHEYSFPLQGGRIPGASDIHCEGERYEQFLIQELKPFIDARYRTLSDRDNTALMGSSMGGLVTYHLGFRNPDVFSKLGILSPYFYRLELNTLEETRFYIRYEHRPNVNIWMDIGGIEDNILVRHVRSVADELVELGFQQDHDLVYREWPYAAHTEQDWAERVHLPLLYLFGTPACESEGEPPWARTGLPKRDKRYSHDARERVQVELSIKVPPGTPAKDMIWIGKLAVPRISAGVFGGTFKLPKGMGVRFRIHTDLGYHEAGPAGEELPFRRITWDHDMRLECSVKGWRP
ncbi:alpha/beta hydrolase [Paenibacillus algicola]|uniref:alpha/beta hydrolase n=1 Tax=Paenibacillus algicola TaxID=2565926 RepID=UPI0010FF59F7|nr:alpha/beta hydrolase-fold protein [Paenibacillus algicola]